MTRAVTISGKEKYKLTPKEWEEMSWPELSIEEECYRRGFRQGAYAVESGGTTAREACEWGKSNDPRPAPGTWNDIAKKRGLKTWGEQFPEKFDENGNLILD